MSFATVLGGTCTVIGTSTNLVVSGLQLEKYGTKNPENVFGFFTITPWGIPYAIWVGPALKASHLDCCCSLTTATSSCLLQHRCQCHYGGVCGRCNH